MKFVSRLVLPLCFLSLLLLLFLASPALAHIPLMAQGNENISEAMHISHPDKSWAVYGRLPEGAAHYYSLDLEEGDRISLSLFRSADPKEGEFQPSLALIGPGLEEEEKRPKELPALPPQASDLKILAAEENEAPTATYEPFGPTSFIGLAEINITAPEGARYYAVVYRDASSSTRNDGLAEANIGHYGLSVGYKEEISFSDRIKTPLRLISVYLWEGQSLAMILIPYLLAQIIALALFWRGSRRTSFCLAGTLAGFLFLASSASAFNQMVFSLTRAPLEPEVYITLAIVIFHALLGVAAIRLARGEAGILQRALLAVLGTLGLLAGSGLIIGPLLSIAASFLPSRSGCIFSRTSVRA